MEGLSAGEKHQVLLGVPAPARPTPWPRSSSSPTGPRSSSRTTRRWRRSSITSSSSSSRERRGIFRTYYDYYQPETYIAARHIHREGIHVNEEIDRLRLSATKSLFERRDAVIGFLRFLHLRPRIARSLGRLLFLEKGQKINREDIMRRLVEILYERNEGKSRGTFRVRGDVIEVYPSYEDCAYRIELLGDQIESLAQIDPLFGAVKQRSRASHLPEVHFVVKPERKT